MSEKIIRITGNYLYVFISIWNVFKSFEYFINCAFVSDLTLDVEKMLLQEHIEIVFIYKITRKIYKIRHYFV